MGSQVLRHLCKRLLNGQIAPRIAQLTAGQALLAQLIALVHTGGAGCPCPGLVADHLTAVQQLAKQCGALVSRYRTGHPSMQHFVENGLHKVQPITMSIRKQVHTPVNQRTLWCVGGKRDTKLPRAIQQDKVFRQWQLGRHSIEQRTRFGIRDWLLALAIVAVLAAICWYAAR